VRLGDETRTVIDALKLLANFVIAWNTIKTSKVLKRRVVNETVDGDTTGTGGLYPTDPLVIRGLI